MAVPKNTCSPEEMEHYTTLVEEFVHDNQEGVSFAQVEELLRPCIPTEGDWALLGSYENLVFWAGMSPEFFLVIDQLLNEHRIRCKPAPLIVYLVDGKYPSFPIAKRIQDYKELHWLPVTLHPGNHGEA